MSFPGSPLFLPRGSSLSLKRVKQWDPANEVVVVLGKKMKWFRTELVFVFFALGLKLHTIFLFRPTKTYMQRSCRTQRIWNEFLGGRNVVNFRSSGIVASYEWKTASRKFGDLLFRPYQERLFIINSYLSRLNSYNCYIQIIRFTQDVLIFCWCLVFNRT